MCFCPFLFATILSVFHQITTSDYPFGIFKLFLLIIVDCWFYFWSDQAIKL